MSMNTYYTYSQICNTIQRGNVDSDNIAVLMSVLMIFEGAEIDILGNNKINSKNYLSSFFTISLKKENKIKQFL